MLFRTTLPAAPCLVRLPHGLVIHPLLPKISSEASPCLDFSESFHLPAASHVEGLPPKVLLTITKLQCMLENKQERIAALERQVEDLMQDRKFLRTQIENLTSNRSMHTFASPSPLPEGRESRTIKRSVYVALPVAAS